MGFCVREKSDPMVWCATVSDLLGNVPLGGLVIFRLFLSLVEFWSIRVYRTHPQICRWCFYINLHYQWDQKKWFLSWKCFWTVILCTFHFITYRQMLSNYPENFLSMLLNRAVSSLIADEQGCVESALDTVYVWNMDRDRTSGVDLTFPRGKKAAWGPTDTGLAVTWQC